MEKSNIDLMEFDSKWRLLKASQISNWNMLLFVKRILYRKFFKFKRDNYN